MSSGKVEIDEHFGIIIKRERVNQGLTQEEFAELVEVDTRTIQRWETEECIPWPLYVEKIIGILPEVAMQLQIAIKKKERGN